MSCNGILIVFGAEARIFLQNEVTPMTLRHQAISSRNITLDEHIIIFHGDEFRPNSSQVREMIENAIIVLYMYYPKQSSKIRVKEQ